MTPDPSLRPIHVALASYGMSGAVFHAPLLANHPGYVLHSVCERSTQVVQSRYPGVQSVAHFEELLNDPEVELLIVNTPDITHFELAHKALKAGKHVVVEKPFVRSTGQAEELISLAAHKQLLLSVFHNRRWDSGALTVKKLLAEERLGRLVEFQSNYTRFRPEIQAGTWKEDGSVTDILWNLGSHLIDETLSLFGMPDSVSADLDILRRSGSIVDYACVRLFYEKMVATLRATYLSCEPDPRYVLHGERASFVKYGEDPQEAMLKQGLYPAPGWGEEPPSYYGTLHTFIEGNHHYETIPTLPGNYKAYYDGLFEAIRLGSPSPVTPEEATSVIRLIEAAIESHKTGRRISL